MRELIGALPKIASMSDLRPICALCVVEDIGKCPTGFIPIRYTADSNGDADLWRENSFFSRRKTRYLCFFRVPAETEPSYIVESITVIQEGGKPPCGYTALLNTKDTAQRALKRKQICYKLVKYSEAVQAVFDVALMSANKCLDGFSLAGEIDGIFVFYKMGCARLSPGAKLPYNLSTSKLNVYPCLPGQLEAVTPTRKAPAVPPRPTQEERYENLRSNSIAVANESSHQGLEGVEFELNRRLNFLNGSRSTYLPEISLFTEATWMKDEFRYDFRTEKDVNSAGFYTIRR
ncbi:unnamed protein product [Notodromas monacha]|uniref:MABP domain-containing protein n=1 Tax=Notodromas monacha TaxID=399045 RepID=A0A7R9GBV4_9CRUS|nr:unnamed protein product [Notodromas monacha]CAG0915191.1 unnamed protein product [Notodromas monacha]